MRKKIMFWLFFLYGFIFLLPIEVFALDSLKIMEFELLSRGYPQIVIDNLDEDSIIRIYADSTLEFGGATILQYNQNERSFIEFQVLKDGTSSGREKIDGDLSLTWLYSVASTADDDLESVDVTLSYCWTKLPIFRWQDIINISWNPNEFNIKPDSFMKVDKFDTSTLAGQIHSYENGYASGSANGVTWYADLKGYGKINPIKLYGSANFTLTSVNSATFNSTTLSAQYIHRQIPLGNFFSEESAQYTIKLSNVR